MKNIYDAIKRHADTVTLIPADLPAAQSLGGGWRPEDAVLLCSTTTGPAPEAVCKVRVLKARTAPGAFHLRADYEHRSFFSDVHYAALEDELERLSKIRRMYAGWTRAERLDSGCLQPPVIVVDSLSALEERVQDSLVTAKATTRQTPSRLVMALLSRVVDVEGVSHGH
jgi:hypothetical protein